MLLLGCAHADEHKVNGELTVTMTFAAQPDRTCWIHVKSEDTLYVMATDGYGFHQPNCNAYKPGDKIPTSIDKGHIYLMFEGKWYRFFVKQKSDAKTTQ